MYSSHRTRLLFILFTATILSTPARAAETGSSHNLFYLDKLNDKSFFVGRANLVTRDGFSDTFFGYVISKAMPKTGYATAMNRYGRRHAPLPTTNSPLLLKRNFFTTLRIVS